MGLRCLIGHDYGEPRTSRDRNQQGSEVVVTVQEYRECTRCGHRRILSENKEVTTDAGGPTEEQPGAEPTGGEAEDGPSPVESFTRSSTEASVGRQEEPMSAAEDDGVILEDEPEPPKSRSHGAWPESDHDEDADAETEHDPWPDEEPAEPEEPEPPTTDDDPVASGPAAADATADPDASTSDDSGSERSTPRPDNRNTEFVCPDCGETWPSRNASLRPGDICPSCRKGYLEEQVVQ